MLLRNLTEADVKQALTITNFLFAGNLVFKRLDHAGKTRQGGDKFTVTLTVKDSRAPGSRKSQSGRRISAACWHAHGRFMDRLPSGSEIVTTIPGMDKQTVKQPGDDWQDWNAGSPSFPAKASALCDCNPH